MQRYLRQLFAIGNAKEMAFDADPSEFPWRILETKDKPLLLVAWPLDANVVKNLKEFSLAIRFSMVRLGKGLKSMQSFFPVLFDAEESSVSFQRGAIGLHTELVPGADFRVPPLEGYWTAFAHFFSDYGGNLDELVVSGIPEACNDADQRELSGEQIDALTILSAVEHLVADFWHCYKIENARCY